MTLYLGWYFGLGIATLLGFLLLSKATASKNEEILVIASSIEKSWWEKFLVPVAGYSLMLLLWPLLIAGQIKETVLPHNTEVNLEPQEFSVEQKHLLQQITIEEIEHTAMVSDPLNAVPNLPFGHLHPAWLKFKENLHPEDTLWSFAAHYTNEWGDREYREGYAAVRDDNIGPYFLTARRFQSKSR